MPGRSVPFSWVTQCSISSNWSIRIGSLKYFDKTTSPILQLNKNIDLKNLIQTFTIEIVFNNPFKCLQNLPFYILGDKVRNLNHSD